MSFVSTSGASGGACNAGNYRYNNCLAIRQEIQRFESVHPSIYAIYDLLELNSDQVLSLQIREHLLSIEAAISFGRRSFRMSKRRKKCVFDRFDVLDSFVNSQEWTLNREVPELKLGIVGSISSGKSALVHRYLTNRYMQDESPEGGRFKKEVISEDDQSNMLLIRDEAGPPELQFSRWVDAVIFVFNVYDSKSFETIKEYYSKFKSYCSNLDKVIIVLVGTKDPVDINSQRVIDEYQARKFASEMHGCCKYYETQASHGLNVDLVFQETCNKIIKSQRSLPHFSSIQSTSFVSPAPCLFRSTSPAAPPPVVAPHSQMVNSTQSTDNNNYLNNNFNSQHQPYGSSLSQPDSFSRPGAPLGTFASLSSNGGSSSNGSYASRSPPPMASGSIRKMPPPSTVGSLNRTCASAPTSAIKPNASTASVTSGCPVPPRRVESKQQEPVTLFTPISAIKNQLQQSSRDQNALPIATTAQQLLPIQFTKEKSRALETVQNVPTPITPQTPLATPNLNRKARRRSNLFTQLSSSKHKNLEEKSRNGELGSGRTIPIRQGALLKKSVTSALNTKLSLKNKEWKKKYVTLTTDGWLTYHPSLHDYMQDAHGKRICLAHTTVKIPGGRPRGSVAAAAPSNSGECSVDGVRFSNSIPTPDLTCAFGELLDGPAKCSICNLPLDERRLPSTNPALKDKEKKKHRRALKAAMAAVAGRSVCDKCILEQANAANSSEEEEFVFVIVSLDNKQWHFQASSAEERESWLQAIEQQILNCLQGMQSDKEKSRSHTEEQLNNERAALDQVRRVAGNDRCLECDAPNPSWASLNLGALICIECSGIHRNMGTHISKVRSLELDDWPQENLAVMMALGNEVTNKIWEFNTKGHAKPSLASSREEKEQWIRMKYEKKEFLCPLPVHSPMEEQLQSAIKSCNVMQVFTLLSHINGNSEIVFKEKRLTPLHLAAQSNSIAIAQLVIWYLSKVNAVDEDGRNAFSYARSKEMQDFLKQQGCTEQPVRLTSVALPKNINLVPNKVTGMGGTLSRRSQPNSLANPDIFDTLPASII